MVNGAVTSASSPSTQGSGGPCTPHRTSRFAISVTMRLDACRGEGVGGDDLPIRLGHRFPLSQRMSRAISVSRMLRSRRPLLTPRKSRNGVASLCPPASSRRAR